MLKDIVKNPAFRAWVLAIIALSVFGMVAQSCQDPPPAYSKGGDCRLQKVSPSRYNDALKARSAITGNDPRRWRSQPVTGCKYDRLIRRLAWHAAKCHKRARLATASWYGPGFYGKRTASGQVLTKHTIGVANKTIRPFGVGFYFHYGGRTVFAPVIDDGPHVAGRTWDLTGALKNALGFGSVGEVRTSKTNCWVRR